MVVMPMAAAGLRFTPRSSRNTASCGLHAAGLAGQLVEPRVGLAHADLARLDHVVEEPQRARRGRRPAASVGKSSKLTQLFVRQAVTSRSRQRRTASTIAGRISPASSGISARASTVWPSSRHSASNRSQNSSKVTSLRSKRRPGVGVGVGRVDRADEVAGQAGARLEAVEGLERAREDHPAEVEEGGTDRHGGHRRVTPMRNRVMSDHQPGPGGGSPRTASGTRRTRPRPCRRPRPGPRAGRPPPRSRHVDGRIIARGRRSSACVALRRVGGAAVFLGDATRTRRHRSTTEAEPGRGRSTRP